MALCLMIVTDITTLQQSGKLMGIIGANIAFGAMIGPYMASGFTQSVTWRALFWLLCPLSLSTALALYFLLPRQVIPPEPLKNKLVKIDYVGILLSSSGTILLLVPISGINTEWSVSSPWVIAMFTLGSFFLFLFVLNEWKLARLPMFPRKYRLAIASSVRLVLLTESKADLHWRHSSPFQEPGIGRRIGAKLSYRHLLLQHLLLRAHVL